MEITDARGETRQYRAEKIIASVQRAGVSREQARQVEQRVAERAWGGITTKKLHAIVFDEMKERDESAALRYRLREAIAALNPKFHEFEKYMTQVLREHGIDATWSPRPKPRGECTDHELDIVAEEDGKTYVIECKHHYHHHRYTGLDVPMRQWARLQDLEEGRALGYTSSMDPDRAWVMVNTKLSDHAKQYAECKDIRMTAWKYPDGDGLERLVESVDAYPITILRPPHHVRVELSKRNILTLQQLLGLSDEQKRDLGLEKSTVEDLQRRSQDVIEG